jgi:ABC-type Fe2+-enterobactin transport system substrate-binding protein
VDRGIGAGQLLHQLGFTLADLPAGLHLKSQGKRHDIIQLGGENLATGLNGEGLFVFAGDQKDVDAIYANPLLAHLPRCRTSASGRWERRRSAWIITARCWCYSV